MKIVKRKISEETHDERQKAHLIANKSHKNQDEKEKILTVGRKKSFSP